MGECDKGDRDGKSADKVAISVSQESGCFFGRNVLNPSLTAGQYPPKTLKHFSNWCEETMKLESARVGVCERENFPFLCCMQRSCLGGKYGKSVGVKVVGSPVDLANPVKDDFQEHFHCDPNCIRLHATSSEIIMCACWNVLSQYFPLGSTDKKRPKAVIKHYTTIV